jgi:hypothetical protein
MNKERQERGFAHDNIHGEFVKSDAKQKQSVHE